MAESSFTDAVRRIMDDHMDKVNTALECTVVAYSGGKVDVQPKGAKTYLDGDSNPYPVLHGLPMQWPQFANGKAGVKGPVTVGDDCLLIVVQHAVAADTSGDTRRYDLVDSYVVPGAGYNDEIPGNDNMTLYFGGASLALTPQGKLIITAPGGIEEHAPTYTSNAAYKIPSANIGGIEFGTHKHSGVESGSSNSGGPSN